jgi:hypothetical protein
MYCLLFIWAFVQSLQILFLILFLKHTYIYMLSNVRLIIYNLILLSSICFFQFDLLVSFKKKKKKIWVLLIFVCLFVLGFDE